MGDKKKPSKIIKVVEKGSEIASHPLIKALAKFAPWAGAIVGILSSEYERKKKEEILDTLHKAYTKVQKIDQKYIDRDFFNSKEGKRAFVTAYRSLLRDSREEKIEAMSTLLANLTLKSKLSYDERELYIDVLDALNPFQLAVLGKIDHFYHEQRPNRRIFDPNGIASFFEDKGIDKQLTYQAIAILANYFLVNRGSDATIGGGGLTYHYTDFGEKFFTFISEVQRENSCYLLNA